MGAVGDLYFWATIRPAAILVGLGGVVFFKNLSLQLTSIGFMLVLYNIPHFHIRLMGLKKGYINGYNIYKCLKIEKFITVKSAYQFTGALVLGVIMALLILEPGLKDFRHILIFITAIVATGFLRHKGKMMQLSVLLPLIFAIILGIL